MVQFDKPLHPVVLYELYSICIFMKNARKLKRMRENHVKTISLGEGLRNDQSCSPRTLKIHAKLFSGTL